MFTFFSDTWADAVDRGLCFTLDRCIVEAAHHPMVGRTLVANAPRGAPGLALRRLQGRRSPPLPSSTAPMFLTQPIRLRRRDPRDVRDLRAAYRTYDRQLTRSAARAGLERPVVITASPFVAAFCDLSWARSVVYYAYDDWAAHPAFESLAPAIVSAYEQIAAGGRSVAAVSQPILDRIRPQGRAEVISNGVEPEEWAGPLIPPDWARRSDAPLFLYVGSIGSRLDMDMVRATAQRFEDAEILMVGPHADAEVIDQLRTLPNVRLHGPVGRGEVAGLVGAADVCLMPHRRTDLTISMSPLKIYEYLAGGAPVVATDLPPVATVDGRVIKVPAGDAAAFADGVEAALGMGRASESERSNFIEQNSWSHRFGQLLDLSMGDDDTRR